MKLSPHFELSELVSDKDTAKPDAAALANLEALCKTALEPLRAALGRPLTVTSGYRSPAYNASIGGAPGSQHTQGIAADIAIGSDDACIKAAALASKIAAIGGVGVYPGRGFIHVDIRPRVSKRTVTWWAQINGKYQPLPASLRAAIKAQGGQC